MLLTAALPAAAQAAPAGLDPPLAGQWLGGLAVVLVLIVLSLWLLQRLSRWHAPAGGQLRVLGGLSLGGRERLLVVEVGQTQLVLGVAPGRVQTLHVLEGEARLERAAGSFGQQLKHMLTQRGEER
ncbi:hypothetical protein JCM13664_13790 [Methylothermus subterraneus]